MDDAAYLVMYCNRRGVEIDLARGVRVSQRVEQFVQCRLSVVTALADGWCLKRTSVLVNPQKLSRMASEIVKARER